MSSAPLGYVRFWSPTISVLAPLGDGSPVLTQGFAGWEEVEMPRRKSRTVWKGRQPLKQTIPLLFDTLHDERNAAVLERTIRNFERLCGVGIPGEPPVIQFDSAGLVPYDFHDSPHIRWVVDGYEPGETLRAGPHRVRQETTVTVMEYVEDTQLAVSAAALRRTPSKPHKCTSKHKRYTVKKNDTLSSIAKKEYGDADCWRVIGSANKIRDPRKKLKVGRKLRLPNG